MSLKARVDKETDEIYEYRDLSDSEIPPHKVADWRPVEDTNPPYDPMIQVSEGPVITVYPDKVGRVWTVRDKTPEEKHSEVDQAVNAIDETQYTALVDLHKRVSVLEGAPVVAPFGDYLRGLMKKEKK